MSASTKMLSKGTFGVTHIQHLLPFFQHLNKKSPKMGLFDPLLLLNWHILFNEVILDNRKATLQIRLEKLWQNTTCSQSPPPARFPKRGGYAGEAFQPRAANGGGE